MNYLSVIIDKISNGNDHLNGHLNINFIEISARYDPRLQKLLNKPGKIKYTRYIKTEPIV